MPCGAEMKVSDPLLRGIGSRYMGSELGRPLDITVMVVIDSGKIVTSFTDMAFHLVCLDRVDDLGETDCETTGGMPRALGFHWTENDSTGRDAIRPGM